MGDKNIKNEQRTSPRGSICFGMELYPEPLSLHSQRLILNTSFRLEEFRFALGSLFVGITGGRLQLRFVNGQFSKAAHGEKKRPLKSPVCNEPVRLPDMLVPPPERGVAASINATVGPNSVTKFPAESFVSRVPCASEVYMSSGGLEQAPYWDFAAKLPRALRGECCNEVLGEFSFDDADQCGEVHAEFYAPPQALWIAGPEEVWPARMPANQRIVRRLLIWRWLRNRVKTRVRLVAPRGQPQ